MLLSVIMVHSISVVLLQPRGSLGYHGAIDKDGSLWAYGAIRFFGSLFPIGTFAYVDSLSSVGAIDRFTHSTLVLSHTNGSLNLNGTLFEVGSLSSAGAFVVHGSLRSFGATSYWVVHSIQMVLFLLLWFTSLIWCYPYKWFTSQIWYF